MGNWGRNNEGMGGISGGGGGCSSINRSIKLTTVLSEV